MSRAAVTNARCIPQCECDNVLGLRERSRGRLFTHPFLAPSHVRIFVCDQVPPSRACYPKTTLPENLLRLYFKFSASMSRTSGLEFMKLLGEQGREIKAAFLPLDADF